jgi:archaellum biogenesis ATPase FlaH|tara:strand:+ start:565 stop:1926 length:1362 start_codon:yes stop_codon:yes gene_type:complete
MTNLQTIILKTLTNNEEYCRKALPHIKAEYFENEHKPVYELILQFLGKFNKLPNSPALEVEFQKSDYVNRSDRNEIQDLIVGLKNYEEVQQEWLLTSTEEWCKQRAVYLAIIKSIGIIDGKEETLTDGAIPGILSKALSVSFDTNVGHDYFENAEKRYDFYHLQEDKIPFDISLLNTITKGGVSNKTLNIILAGTGVGKSLAMCHFAAANLTAGQDVLYITMEMAEERIAERIDANLFDVPIDQLETLPKDMFQTKINKLKAKTRGKLIVKEYPTASAHVGHFRALLDELKLKKDFKPDVIYIDYLNICGSARMKGLGGSINSYSLIKAIAEEIRGLAVEHNVPIWSATQVTRTGFGNTDIELTDTSESFGLPATADLMLALISTEQLEGMNQLMVKQLKNRYNDATQDKRFVVGIDRSKMRLYDVEDSAQTLSSDEISTAPATNSDFSAFKI